MENIKHGNVVGLEVDSLSSIKKRFRDTVGVIFKL